MKQKILHNNFKKKTICKEFLFFTNNNDRFGLLTNIKQYLWSYQKRNYYPYDFKSSRKYLC